jgi:hypothetical protein
VVPKEIVQSVAFDDLIAGDVLACNLVAADGRILLPARSVITEAMLERLKGWAEQNAIAEPISVAIDADSPYAQAI